MRNYEVEVFGRVQGVNFRRNVKSFAIKNGLKGRVMNIENGSVLIIVQCAESKLHEMVNWIKSCPGISRVRNVSIRERPGEDFQNFEIVREDNFLKDKSRAFRNFGRSLKI